MQLIYIDWVRLKDKTLYKDKPKTKEEAPLICRWWGYTEKKEWSFYI